MTNHELINAIELCQQNIKNLDHYINNIDKHLISQTYIKEGLRELSMTTHLLQQQIPELQHNKLWNYLTSTINELRKYT